MRTWILLAAVAAGGLVASPAVAADHTDGPAVQANSDADINDLYAWLNDAGDKLVMIQSVGGLSGSTMFSDSVQYVFHIGRDAVPPLLAPAASETTLVCTFATNQEVSCYLGTPGSPATDFAIGDASTSLTSSAGGFQVHTGQHADPFYFYLGGFNNARASVLAVAGLTNNFNNLPNAAGCLPNGVMTTSLADLPNSTFPDVNIGQALRDQLTGARDANLATGSFAEDTFAANNVLALVVEIDKSSIAGSGEFFSVWASTHTTN